MCIRDSPYSATALILLLIWIQVAAAKAPHVCGSEKDKTLLEFSDRKELNKMCIRDSPNVDFSQKRKIDFKTFIGIMMNSGGATMSLSLIHI